MDGRSQPFCHQCALCIVLALIVGLLNLSCHTLGRDDQQPTARERDGLYGPVRTMEVIQAVLIKKDGEWEIETERPVQHTSYNRHGQTIEQRMYAEDDSLDHTLQFRYDAHGQATEIVRHDSQNQPTHRTVFSYDAKGKLVESHVYTTRNGTETSAGREAFYYNEAGQEQTLQQYDAAGTLRSRVESIYDEQGRLIQKKWHDAKDVVVRSLERQNDYQGTLVSEKIYDYAPDGTLTKRVDIRYNTHGEPQEQIEYQDAGRFKREQRFTYQADAFGNWTLQTMTTRTIRDESPSFASPVVISRTFTYFDRDDG